MTLQQILKLTSEVTGISEESILSPCRYREVVIARSMFCYHAVNNGYCNKHVADFLNRYHNSIKHFMNRHGVMVFNNKDYQVKSKQLAFLISNA